MNTLTMNVKPLIITFGALLMLAFTLAFASSASAHGYVNKPESRALLCSEGINFDCGRIIYEPHSLEAPGNFPEGGPADGNIAGAGTFHELDDQSENRWAKVGMTSGAFTFEWTLTAAHATEKWDYYITKENWDPNTPLKRSDLELFCTVNDNGERPPFTVNHDCVIPERTGYHVILAYWEVADTANAFYNVIDANFDGDFVEPEEPGEPGPGDPDPEEPGDVPVWDANAIYTGGDQVSYNGKIYEAQWWTLGDTPGSSSVWIAVNNDSGGDPGNDEGDELAGWSSSSIYLAGDQVSYNGAVYEALWWSQNNTPGDSSVWILINESGSSTASELLTAM